MNQNELAWSGMIYINALGCESMHEAAARLERILADLGLDFQCFEIELRDKDGNVLETDV